MTELFQTFDESGRALGLVPRHEVHARGLWHKSAHVFLLTAGGDLYVQRRAAGKDLYPGRWDFSVGEHLQPGETYLQGALRGLVEELAVTGVTLEPISGVRRYRCDIPELGVSDRELQQAFRGRYDGPVSADAAEVDRVEVWPLAILADRVRRNPDDFTPWFLDEMATLNLPG